MNSLVLSLLLANLLVGDYKIYSMPMSYTVALLSLPFCLVISKRINLSIFIFLLIQGILLCGSLFFLRYSYIPAAFYFGTLLNCFNLAILMNYPISMGRIEKYIWICILLALVILPIMLKTRGFVFGPNIYYRLLFAISFFAIGRVNFVSVIGIAMATFSRGSIATYILSIVSNLTFKKIILAIGFLVFSYWVIATNIELPRVLRFYDTEGSNSLLDRFLVFDSIIPENILFGISAKNDFQFIKYPHNSLVEFIWMFGIFGLFISIWLIYQVLKSTSPTKGLSLLFFVPTLFSGGYIDNLPWLIVGLAIIQQKRSTS